MDLNLNDMINKMVQKQLRAMLADKMVAELFQEEPEPEVKIELENVETYYGSDDWSLMTLAEVTPCFGHFAKKEEACQGCDLASLCSKRKDALSAERKEARDSLKDLEKILEDKGVDKADLVNFKDVFKEASLSKRETRDLFYDTVCALTFMPLKANEPGTFVPGIGLVIPELAQYAELKWS